MGCVREKRVRRRRGRKVCAACRGGSAEKMSEIGEREEERDGGFWGLSAGEVVVLEERLRYGNVVAH
jgi:hypothetical protein